MKYPLFALLTALLFPGSAFAAEGEYRYERKYKPGQKFSYTYERRESLDGNLFRTIRGVSNHEVRAEATTNTPAVPPPPRPTPPAPNESVTWSSLRQAFEPGRVEDSTEQVKQAPPIGLNLPLTTPPIIPQMPPALSQPVEDLREIYQTFHPANLEKLKKVGDKATSPARYSTWGNARVGPSGAQCNSEVVELLKLDPEKATFRRRVSPSQDCKELKFPISGMSTPLLPNTVVGTYFVDRKGAKLTTGWGTYESTYEIEASRADGRLLRMQIKNISYSNRRADCDSNFRNCQMPADGYVERLNVGEQVATFVSN